MKKDDTGRAGSAARPAAARAQPASGAPSRDIRLDFFRGVAMILILISHVPGNKVTYFIPARFGWSDSAEIFVFCSGMASAVAFGGTFLRAGWWMGCARVLKRLWEVYWAHIGLFLALATTLVAIDMSGIEAHAEWHRIWLGELNLEFFFDDPMANLLGLMTLTYVPNYFDILPMYLLVIAMIPAVMLLARVHPWLAMAASVALWAVAQSGALQLPAEPWSDREWFFNPFAWQMLFFTGFAFMRGWLLEPPVNRWLIGAAVIVLLASIPFARWYIYRDVDWILDWRKAHAGLFTKTEQGIFRYLHFLAMAYLAWLAVGPAGRRLVSGGSGLAARVKRAVVAATVKVGQQSLAAFVFAMWLSIMMGFALDFVPGRGWAAAFGVTAAAILLLVAVAYLLAWFKREPWRGA